MVRLPLRVTVAVEQAFTEALEPSAFSSAAIAVLVSSAIASSPSRASFRVPLPSVTPSPPAPKVSSMVGVVVNVVDMMPPSFGDG